LGFTVDRTRYVGDQGVDVIAEYRGLRFAIQAKRYINNVGNDAVQQVVAGRAMYGCQGAMVVTTSGFTSSACQLADVNGCHLIDGAQITNLVKLALAYYTSGIGHQPPPAEVIVRSAGYVN
jgi:restriction system protein